MHKVKPQQSYVDFLVYLLQDSTIHQLRLALLSALGVCYKSRKVTIAYNFAKRLLGTNSNLASHAKLTTHVVEATKHNMMEEPLVYKQINVISTLYIYLSLRYAGLRGSLQHNNFL